MAIDQKTLKSYSDSYLYKKFPLYSKLLTDAVMKDPVIDKSDPLFKDVVYEVKRTKVSDCLIRILNSQNTILLDPEKPLPRTFKVFCAKDFKDKKNPTKLKTFIDCSFVITRDAKYNNYETEEIKLISYLINAGMTTIYHKAFSLATRRSVLIMDACKCFSKMFTFVVDYLTKVSIQESAKAKVMYLAAMYFLEGIVQLNDKKKSREIAIKIAEISNQEASILDILLDKASSVKGMPRKDSDPFENIKVFVNALRDVIHLNPRSISTDLVVERWMKQYGPGTVLGLEYFPNFSAAITDAYTGGYINQQRSIEKVCGADMVSYGKDVISLLETVV